MSTGTRLAGAVLAVVAVTAVSTATTPRAFATKSEKVTICHATNSQTNPYVRITVNSSSINEQNNAGYNGHGTHDGGVWYQGIAAHSWGDIIPPFESPKGTTYPGSNWSVDGRAIYTNGCAPVVAAAAVAPTAPSKSHSQDTSPVQSENPVVTQPVPATVTSVDTPVPTRTAPTPAVTELPHTGSSLAVLILGVLASLTTYGVAYFLKRN